MRVDASLSLSQSIIPDRTALNSETAQEKVKTEESAQSKESAKDEKNRKEESLKEAENRQIITKLQARDSEVRAHEAAHLAAAGGIASGGASFTYQRGPDGKMYAVGGEVPISISGGSSPQETIKQMRQVAAAALAPADPSPQDYAVASSARSEEMRALAELRKEQAEAQKELGMQKYTQGT